MNARLGRWTVILLGVGVLVGASAQVRAADEAGPTDKDLAAAKEAFEAAQNAFVRGEFDAAADKFLTAYDKKPYPAFLFNAAVSYEKAKRFDKAKQYFERYLGNDPNASDAAQVKLRIEMIDKLLAAPPPAPAPPAAPQPAPGAPAPGGPSAGAPGEGGATPPASAPAAPGSAPGSQPPGSPAPGPAAPAETPPPTAALALPEIDTKGLVVIDSKPQGATIYLNDKRSGPFGKTPWQGSLESKPVRLLLEAKGWKPEERAITPRSDKLIDIYIALSEEHYLGWVEIVSNVPGADVYIDRKDIGAIGRTPFTGHLKPGKHTIFVEKFGWEPAQDTIDIQPGTATQHTINLTAANKGWVSVTGRGVSGGQLFVDDKPSCATPCRAEVAPGKHEIRVEKKGMEDYEAKLEIARGMETNVDVQFSARPARTRAITEAIVAAVLIGGGVFVGQLAQHTKDDINADIAAGQLVDNTDARFTRGKAEAIGADVLYGLGAIVAVFAISNAFSHGPDSVGALDQRQISFSPTMAPGGGGLAIWGRF
jgi:tetratricopeptide (TPR) repeat protein